jgi:hypothetical protein
MDDVDVATTDGVGRRQRCAAWQTSAVGGLAWQPREAATTVDGSGRRRWAGARCVGRARGRVGGDRRRGAGGGGGGGGGGLGGGGGGGGGGGDRRRGAGAGRGRHGGVGGGCSVEREEDRRKRFACSPASVISNNSRRPGGAADGSYIIAVG